MGFRINTNVAALNAKANADLNSKSLDASLSRLSSGLRINSAADDASGMAIADSLRSQANTLGQAISNGNDALGILQTFDKDIIFICAGVVHPKAIEYLKDRNLVITQKVLAFPYYINLKDFSYAAVGFSVAHTLSYLATYLSHKNIIFIGQDLAYAENGNSHPDDYQNSANYESQMYEHILTTAYGGNGKVETHSIWLLFKNWFENEMIPNTRKMGITTYNCTEGGARIEGTIEKPFLWACENLLHKDLNKPFEKLEPLSLNKQNEFLLKAIIKFIKVLNIVEILVKYSAMILKIYKVYI